MKLIRPVLCTLLLALPLSLLSADPPAPMPRELPPPEFGLPPGEMVVEVAMASEAGEVIDWGVKAVNAPAAWAKGITGKGVIVAVLDTGCDPDHRDLKDRIVGGKDFTSSRIGWKDFNRHGTHCAGTVGASGNGWGLKGVAPEYSLLVGKVLSDQGSGSVDGIARAIDWATINKADVISMSLGGPGSDGWIPPALERAEAAGVIVVAAAGNEGPGQNTCGFPGQYKQTIAVAAVDSQDRTAAFSSRCPAVFTAAPGVQIQSTLPGGLFGVMSGTSMATPHVAGLAALWVQAHPEIPKKDRPAAWRKALQASCKDLPPAGRDTATGYGFPDAAKLIEGGTPPVDPPVTPGKTPFIFVEDLTPEARQRLGLK